MGTKYQDKTGVSSISYAHDANNVFRVFLEQFNLASILRKALLLIMLIILTVSVTSAALSAGIAAPTSIDNCAEGAVTLSLTNAGAGQATNLVASINMPAGFSYKAGTGSFTVIPNGGSPIGPTSAEPTIGVPPNDNILTWNLATNLNPGDQLQVNFHLVPSCLAQSGQNVQYTVNYKIGGTSQTQISGSTQSTITVNKGLLKVTKLTDVGEMPSGSTVVEKSVGETVNWVITIKNIGTGPATYVKVEDVLQNGLQMVSNDALIPVPVTPGGTFNWEYPTGIAVGQEKVVHMQARVVGCENLFNEVTATWGCNALSQTCQTPLPYAKASIKLLPKEPLFTYTPPSSITVPYCGDTTVSIPYSNTGDGTAINMHIHIQNMPAQYQITDLAVTNFPGASYDAGTQIITIGDIAPIPSGTISFKFGMKSSGACDASSGIISFTPNYQDQCGDEWAPPTTLMAYTLDQATKPGIAVSKTGPDVLHLGETGTYSLSVTYNKGSCTNDPISANIVDTYPAGFEVVDAAGGTVSTLPGVYTITWPSQSLTSGTAWTRTIQLKAPSTSPCLCGQSATNMLSVSAPNDCCGCTLSGSASKLTLMSCDNPSMFTSAKEASSSVESCTSINYKTTYEFPVDSPITSWDQLSFTEFGDNSQTTTGTGLATFIINEGIPQTAPITLGVPMSLSFLGTMPAKPVKLDITYTLSLTPTSTIGMFVDWSELRITGAAGYESCLGDNIYREGVLVDVGKSDFSLDMTYDNKMNSCGTYTFKLNLHQNGPYNGYDMQITYDDTNFAYIAGTSSVSGISNAGTAIPSTPFEPTRGSAPNDHKLTWNLGTNVNCPGAGHTGVISFQVQKTCSQDKPIGATLDYKDNCGVQQPQGTFNGAPLLLDKAHLNILKTPELIFANQKEVFWKVYITNTGSGTAYSVSVVDTLGAGLTYSAGTGKVDNVPQEPVVAGQVLTWAISDMDPNARHVIELGAKITGCSGLTNDVIGKWGCLGSPCQEVHGSSTVEQIQTTLQFGSHTAPRLDPCGDESGNFVIQMANAGDATAYNVRINELLPAGVVISGAATITGYTGAAPSPTYSGNSLTWSFADPWAPGTTATISFKAKVTDCGAFAAVSNPVARARATFELPCGTTLQSAESPVQVIKYNPHLTISKTPASSITENSNPIFWTITVTNTGDYIAKNVVVKDTLPVNVAYDFANPVPQYPVASPLVWDLVDIPAGESRTITLNAHVTSCAADTQNSATVEWGCCVKETSTSTATLVTLPHISLSLNPAQFSTCGGTRTITIRNTGATAYAPISGDELTYTLPTNFVFKTGSATITGTSTHSPALDPVPTYDAVLATLVWGLLNIDKVNPGETITLTFDIVNSAGQCGISSLSSELVSYNYDSSCGAAATPITLSPSVLPTLATLVANVVPLTQPVSSGGTASWIIYVNNTGTGTANNVDIADVLGAGFDTNSITVQDRTGQAGTGSKSVNTITWTGVSISNLAGSNSWSKVITANPMATGALTNQLTVTGTCVVTGCIYSQDSKGASASRLALTKTSQSPKTIGDPEDFTIVSEFWGSDTYDNAIIVDTLPKGLRYVSYECNPPDSGQCIGTPTQAPGPGGSNIITWNLGTFSSSKTVSIKVHTVVENIPGNLAGVTLTNSVEASHDAGGQHYQRTATAQVILTEPSLTLTKAANPSGPLSVGSTVPYTLTIHAASGATRSTAYELVLTDVLPLHLVYENSNPDASYDSITRKLTWHIPSLAPGATQTITYNAQVGPGATSGETLTNNAEVDWTSTSGTNPDERSYTGTTTHNVNLDTSSVVTKARSDSNDHTIGDIVSYTVQTTLPKAIARQVVITDTLPAGLIYVPGSRVITPVQPGSLPVSEIVSTPNDGTVPVTITWTFGDVDNSDNLHNIKVEFNAIVANKPINVRGSSIGVNSVKLSWKDAQDV
ncbi:MAG: isopeptide-forming domain-containing fimbrial protein, partial [Methanothrix sp.]